MILADRSKTEKVEQVLKQQISQQLEKMDSMQRKEEEYVEERRILRSKVQVLESQLQRGNDELL